MNCAHPTAAATLTAPSARFGIGRQADAAHTLVGRLAATLHAWRHQWRSRQDLRDLDDHLLKDIGLTRSQLHAEASKPFWRA